MTFELKPFQKEAIQALKKSPSHVICVAPTGSGKSLIYEEIAVLESSKTLLITPLVALARQQFEKMKKRNIPVTLSIGGVCQGPPRTNSGAWIVSPEALQFDFRKRQLAEWKPNFLVLDECHCLWEWGKNFRPAFVSIPPLLCEYQIQRSLWLTATLPFEAREQLREAIPSPVEMGGFEFSPRLKLWVERTPWEDRVGRLLKWVLEKRGFGIVFVSTREGTQRVGRLIEAMGKKVVQYHAGLSQEERRNTEKLIENRVPEIIVATSAFGMGMDYSHLSSVVLWQAPSSILSLVQTIGRVGRNRSVDGEALVLWEEEDFRLLEWTLAGSEQKRKDLLAVKDFLSSKECRQVYLKRYFDQIDGDLAQSGCQRCDFCS